MIDAIANDMGLQIFITSHSYFVIKKLYLIALKRAGKVSCISMNKGQAPRVYDLYDGMPENSIDVFRKELQDELRIWRIPVFNIINEKTARDKHFII